MISQIDMASFGSFSGFEWKKIVRDSAKNIQNFKRLNILYGRNYSGKTTLSRVFRALETRKIPPNYLNPSFVIFGEKGSVTESTISAHNYDIRVYNRDFVTENLSFLVNQVDGEIKTFAIVGEKNKEIEDAIAVIEKRLGSVETKSGLRFELELKKGERDRAKADHKIAYDTLEGKLRNHANNDVKKNREYGNALYNIESIKKDIATTKKSGFTPLTSEEQAAKLALLKQEPLPDIDETLSFKPKLESLRIGAIPLLTKEIKPTNPIQELLNDSVLQIWVKQGLGHHRDKREVCAFCRQSLPNDIWKVLDAHFSQESGDLEAALEAAIFSVKDEMKVVASLNSLKPEQFYSEERTAFSIESKALSIALSSYITDLKKLEESLEARKASIFQVTSLNDTCYDAEEVGRRVESINALISVSEGRTKTLGRDKEAAREALRLTNVYSFCVAIEHDSEQGRVANLKSAFDKSEKVYIDAEQKIQDWETEVSTLLAKQNDERKGAERVNALLNHFFGHDGIKLEAKDEPDQKTVKFEITRSGKSAYNLSEGECSLIAFCYFIARLEEPDSKGKDLIIYIDDPISSLDGNHIFFMFSLLESLIAKPKKNGDGSNSYRYGQLFISTHNLDFLKYLKRLSIPRKPVSVPGGKSKSINDDEHFIIERDGASSRVSLMPSYLKDYITEFHYLFHQIYKCKNKEYAAVSHEPFFGFGNNLRKFLEALLFFKYPYHDDKNDTLERIRKFFGEEEDTAIALVNRLNNEFSHLEATPDRGFKPVEIPEITKIANYVLDKIFFADPVQYNALLKSIGEPMRTS